MGIEVNQMNGISRVLKIVRQAVQDIVNGRSPYHGREVSFVRKLVLMPSAERVLSSADPMPLTDENRLLQRIDSSGLSKGFWMKPGNTAEVEKMGAGFVRVVYQFKSDGERFIPRSKFTLGQLRKIPKEQLQRDKNTEDFYNRWGVSQLKFGILNEKGLVEASQGFDAFGNTVKSKVESFGELACPRLAAEDKLKKDVKTMVETPVAS